MCKKTGKYQLLFSFYEKLAAVLADKADLGMCIKSAYRFIQEIKTILTEWFWFPLGNGGAYQECFHLSKDKACL